MIKRIGTAAALSVGLLLLLFPVLQWGKNHGLEGVVQWTLLVLVGVPVAFGAWLASGLLVEGVCAATAAVTPARLKKPLQKRLGGPWLLLAILTLFTGVFIVLAVVLSGANGT